MSCDFDKSKMNGGVYNKQDFIRDRQGGRITVIKCDSQHKG